MEHFGVTVGPAVGKPRPIFVYFVAVRYPACVFEHRVGVVLPNNGPFGDANRSRGNRPQASNLEKPIRSSRIAFHHASLVNTWRVGVADPKHLVIIDRTSRRSAVYIKLKLDCRYLLFAVLGILSFDVGGGRERFDDTLLTVLCNYSTLQ